jgi:hypothetical protein
MRVRQKNLAACFYLLAGVPAARIGSSRAVKSPWRVLCTAGVNRPDQWLFKAAQLEEFVRLRTDLHLTLTGAARAVGLPASSCCGEDSTLNRYLRAGIAGLQRRGRGGAASALSRRIEALGWFIPAASFLYFSAARRRFALAAAIQRTIALPTMPGSWRNETRARFLAHLGADAAPCCPADLREELLSRDREKKPIVPGRIARLIKISPSRLRRYYIEAPVKDLAQIPFAAVTTRLAELQPDGTCRLILELL